MPNLQDEVVQGYPMSDDVFFFGCWDEAGHFLWGQDGRHIREWETKKLGIPDAPDLDTSKFLLPAGKDGFRPDLYEGVLTYLPAMKVTILAWWGSGGSDGKAWDSRGDVNSMIIVKGCVALSSDVWRLFKERFPELEAKLTAWKPIVTKETYFWQ